MDAKKLLIQADWATADLEEWLKYFIWRFWESWYCSEM